jgi:monoamine oxidase
MYDVIIVGGGAAGLMAAKVLSAARKKILLLEARRNLGGRIHRVEGFMTQAEGGAEFIQGNLNATFALLKEANLKKERVEGQFCRVENGKWKVGNDIVEHWDRLLKQMKDCKEDMNVKDFFRFFFHAKKYDTLRKQFTKYVEGYDAADTKNASIFAIRKEIDEENEEQYRPKPDYFALVDFLKEACLKYNAKIKTDEPVLQITRGKDIEVITSSAKYICRKIIIAVPLGVLQCGTTDKGFINFPACAADHLNAAKAIGNGGVIKFLLEFDEAFWLDKKFLDERNIPPPSFISSDAIIPTWWTQYPSSKPLLTGWLAGPASYKLKNYSERKLMKIAMESLSSVFLMRVEQLENKLKFGKIVNWINEPYILGGYSYPTLQTEKARRILTKPVESSFYFAGEYADKNSFSTVDAALQSGKEVAEKILKGE